LLAALATPVLESRWGWPGLRAGLVATVLFQALAAIFSLAAFWPPATLGGIALGIVAGGWFAEYLGISTGLPFGAYEYTTRLQPQVGGVPILVAIAYLGILMPAWAVADLLLKGSRGPEFAIVSALAATAWDLFLDPQLVSWRIWTWRRSGGYFGIPWQNFLGWLIVTALLTVVLQPGPFNPLPLALLYTTAWILEIIALCVVWPLRGPALVGGVVMGMVAVGAWLRLLL